MKSLAEITDFLKYCPNIKSDSKDDYAAQILNLEKKTRKDVLFILELGGFGRINHIIDLIQTFKENKVKINRINETQIIAYCNNEITAEEITSDIQKNDLKRLVPDYHEPPCKINPNAAERLRGK